MHVHANQINPYSQLDSMYAAQKAAAKREAERVRKKLTEFASKLTGEADSEACVVRLGEREESQERPKQRLQQNESRRLKQEQPEAEGKGNSVSDWA